ncbi:MAG TPA: energy-coupling factor transporter transmembrane component T [Myxococcota bacterium]|nr:energy-coupling factor transporter transmembrane component T [Myxococcota bacterium]
MDPRTRIVLILCAGVAAISLESPQALSALTLVCALSLVALRVSWSWWRRGLLLVVALLWGTALSQGLFYSEQPRVALVHLGPLVLWREGVTWGLAQSLRFIAVALAGIALAVSTPPDRLFAALQRMRVPFGLALMASTALRLLPRIASEVLTVRKARAARGRPVWKRSPWAWLVLEVSLMRPVVARSWRRAQVLAEALDSRGFDPVAPRAVRKPLRFGVLDYMLLLSGPGIALAVAGSRVAYLLYTSETLYIQALRPLYGFVRAYL